MNKVIIVNENLCSMSLAFIKEGFDVLTSYCTDKKEIKVYEENLKSMIDVKSLFENNYRDMGADIVAGRIQFNSYSVAGAHNIQAEKRNYIKECYQRIVFNNMPKVFIIESSKVPFHDQEIQEYIASFEGKGYRINKWQLSTKEVLGIPVVENKTYIIGLRTDVDCMLNLINDISINYRKISEYLDFGLVDEKYYIRKLEKLKINLINECEDYSLYCWKNKSYELSDEIRWNYITPPIVCIKGQLRKITHREIARLKGYPEDFVLGQINNSWLYEKLMFASNIELLRLVIKSITYSLNRNYVPNRHIVRAVEFEKLFGRYLDKKGNVINSNEKSDRGYDFIIQKNDKRTYFELKIFTDKAISEGKLSKICINIESSIKDQFVLVIGNVIDDKIKKHYEDQYNIMIWDISNLLYLFSEFPEIKSEFVSLLNYTIGDIEEKQPNTNMFDDFFLNRKENFINNIEENNFIKRLDQIKPGKDEFGKYETLCTEIMKYLFDENLTSWVQQEQTENKLYRFDLCCKIKHGLNHEFFDTVKDFFNTKYIIFEFKNYKERISQKEIYTTEKYLYKTALRVVAIIVSRCGPSENALEAIRGSLRENGKLILCLSDEDVIKMIKYKISKEKPVPEVLMDMLDDMLMKLGK